MRHFGMFVGAVALAACASSESPGTSTTGAGGTAAGGTTGAGGGPGAGGALGAGGAGTGGAKATGGAPGTGGAAAGGSGAGGSGGGAITGTPSSGCSVASPATGATIDGTITVGGQPRTYRLSVPTDYAAGQALPVVFVFNGVGGTGPQAQQAFKLETGHRAIFIYPTALPNSQTPGQIAWDFSLTGIDVPFFDALVTFLTQGYCVDTSRIFALGASSGAIMSNMLGCFRGDVLRAIAPSSGMDWKQGGCKGDVAVMVICGAQDTFNPCDDATNGAVSETNVWVPQNGCATTTAPSAFSDICVGYQGCKSADPVLLCTQPGGHGWPTSNGDFWWQFFMSLD
jgi:polyhydroxybutyrate depolymerase